MPDSDINTSNQTPASAEADIFFAPPQPGKQNKPNAFEECLKALCYFAAFWGSQNIVATVLSIYWGMKKALEGHAMGKVYSADELTVYLEDMIIQNNNLLVILYSIFLILFLLLFFLCRKKNILHETRLEKIPLRSIPALVIFAVGLSMLVDAGLNLLPQQVLADYIQSSNRLLKISPFFIAFISNVIFSPLMEETTFRGLMMTRLNRVFPAWAGILITSVIFGAMHLQIVWIIYAALLGAVFGYVAEHMKSTTAALILHLIINLIGTCLSYSGINVERLLQFTIHTSDPSLRYGVLAVICALGAVISVAGFFMVRAQKPLLQS